MPHSAQRASRPAALRWLALSLLLFATAALAQQVAVPELTARVTDLTGTLDARQRAELEQRLAEFERRKGAQLAVLLVPSTGAKSIEQYGIRVAEAWRLGREKVDDGLLLLVAKNDRTLRIEVGYGLEGVVPDAVANRIIDEIIVPRFRQGDFFGGIRAGLERLMRVIDGEPLPPPAPSSQPARDVNDWLVLFVFGAVVLSRVLARRLGRLPAALVAGLAMGSLAWLFADLVPDGVLVALVAFMFALPGGGARVGIGGGSGGFRSSGSSGGGFRGGGGSFGGGGASGRW